MKLWEPVKGEPKLTSEMDVTGVKTMYTDLYLFLSYFREL